MTVSVKAGTTIRDNMGNRHILKEDRNLEVVKCKDYRSYPDYEPGDEGVYICRKPQDIICGLEHFFNDEKLCVFVDFSAIHSFLFI